jgi:hypothetical protein
MKGFEDLARELAGGLTRRQALWRVGGGLAGALLATLGVRRGEAASPSSTCADECKKFLFPKGNNAYGKCVSSCEACIHSGGDLSQCEADDCICVPTTEGTGFCAAPEIFRAPDLLAAGCTTSADCPSGFACTEFRGGPPASSLPEVSDGNVCVAPCSVTVIIPCVTC